MNAHMDMPESYEEDVLYGLVRTPHCVYLYWELTDRRIRLYRQYFADKEFAKLSLRGYRLSPDDASWSCVLTENINDNIGGRFIDNLWSGCSYFFQVGFYSDNFIPLLTSNKLLTPGELKSKGRNEKIQMAWWDNFLTYTLYSEANVHPAQD